MDELYGQNETQTRHSFDARQKNEGRLNLSDFVQLLHTSSQNTKHCQSAKMNSRKKNLHHYRQTKLSMRDYSLIRVVSLRNPQNGRDY